MKFDDWLFPVVLLIVVAVFMFFWSNKTDQEINEYIRNNQQPTISEMK